MNVWREFDPETSAPTSTPTPAPVPVAPVAEIRPLATNEPKTPDVSNSPADDGGSEENDQSAIDDMFEAAPEDDGCS